MPSTFNFTENDAWAVLVSAAFSDEWPASPATILFGALGGIGDSEAGVLDAAAALLAAGVIRQDAYRAFCLTNHPVALQVAAFAGQAQAECINEAATKVLAVPATEEQLIQRMRDLLSAATQDEAPRNFVDIENRLKYELRVSKDREVATFLGMKFSAYSARKSRNAFPTKDLLVAVQMRPELGIDGNYVLTGVRTADDAKSLIRQRGEALAQWAPHASPTAASAPADRHQPASPAFAETARLDTSPAEPASAESPAAGGRIPPCPACPPSTVQQPAPEAAT